MSARSQSAPYFAWLQRHTHTSCSDFVRTMEDIARQNICGHVSVRLQLWFPPEQSSRVKGAVAAVFVTSLDGMYGVRVYVTSGT